MQQGELIDARIKRFEGSWSAQKHDRIISSIQAYIRRYQGTGLRIYMPSSISNNLKNLAFQLTYLDYPSTTFTHYSITSKLPSIKNKQQFREHIASLFPELSSFISTPSQEKIFEAVWVSSLKINDTKNKNDYENKPNLRRD